MRPLALALFAVPFAACAGTPKAPLKPQAVRVSVINMTGQKLQWQTANGRLRLPAGERVDVLAQPGCAVRVVSDMDSRVQGRVCVSETASSEPLVLR